MDCMVRFRLLIKVERSRFVGFHWAFWCLWNVFEGAYIYSHLTYLLIPIVHINQSIF